MSRETEIFLKIMGWIGNSWSNSSYREDFMELLNDKELEDFSEFGEYYRGKTVSKYRYYSERECTSWSKDLKIAESFIDYDSKYAKEDGHYLFKAEGSMFNLNKYYRYLFESNKLDYEQIYKNTSLKNQDDIKNDVERLAYELEYIYWHEYYDVKITRIRREIIYVEHENQNW